MIRKSNYSRRALLEAIGRNVQAYQDATDEVDEATGRMLRLNRTDMRCLSVLGQAGAMSASELAAATGLTRGAMTTALDRIEAAGYARRVWDQQDRRSVRVEMTGRARSRSRRCTGRSRRKDFGSCRSTPPGSSPPCSGTSKRGAPPARPRRANSCARQLRSPSVSSRQAQGRRSSRAHRRNTQAQE